MKTVSLTPEEARPISKEAYVDKEANWLPAPTGPFILLMRLYRPKVDALTGLWQLPALQLAQ